MSTNQKCLWVVPKAIFPIRDGARVANHALLKSIREKFEEMDIMLFSEEDSDELYPELYNSEFNPSNVFFLKRPAFKNKFKKFLFLLKNFLLSPARPVTTGYFQSKKLKQEVSNILKRRNYDVVIFDGLHPFVTFADLPEFKNKAFVYRAHNVEADLWTSAAEKNTNFLLQKLLLWQGQKMRNLESRIIASAKKIWCIAEDDLNRFSNLEECARVKSVFVPVGLNFLTAQNVRSSGKDQKIKLLFLGKMDWAPNKDGLKWFLEEVWPLIDKEKMELHIVGSGDASWGSELFSAPGITFLGFVKDLESVYRSCDFSIIPIQYGSGTRIKVIESISKGMPIVSTAMGVQGSHLVDYFKAETKEDWIKVLNGLDRKSGEEMAQRAFIQLERLYSPALIAKTAFESISI